MVWISYARRTACGLAAAALVITASAVVSPAAAEPTPAPEGSAETREARLARHQAQLEKIAKTRPENRSRNLHAALYSIGGNVRNEMKSCRTMQSDGADDSPGVWETPPPPKGAQLQYGQTTSEFQLINYVWKPNTGGVEYSCPGNSSIPKLIGEIQADFLWTPRKWSSGSNPPYASCCEGIWDADGDTGLTTFVLTDQ